MTERSKVQAYNAKYTTAYNERSKLTNKLVKFKKLAE